jgi:hypothetical protein
MSDFNDWEPPNLFPGVRVRMSALGRERHPRYGDRRGVIVGQGSPSSWRIKFDERTTVQAIHRDYLEPVPARVCVEASEADSTAPRGGDRGRYKPATRK